MMPGFKCDHCNIILNSHEQYSVHLTGKKHLNKLKLGLQPKVSGTGSDPKVAKLYGTFVKPSDDEVSEVGSDGPGNQPYEQLSSPMQTSSPENSTDSPPPPPPPPPQRHSLPPLTPEQMTQLQHLSQRPSGQTFTSNVPGNSKSSAKRKLYEGRCDICGIDFNSESQEQAHMTGSKHAKKMRLHSSTSENNLCKYCNVQWNSDSQRDQHLYSEGHHKKVAAANVLCESVMTEEHQNNSVSETGNLGTDLGFCEYCMVHYTSESVKINHLNGQKHKKRISIGHAKLDKQTIVDKDGMQKVDKQTYFTCQFCGVKLNSLQQLEIHRAGQKHRDQVNKHKAQGKNVQEEEITMATI